MDNLYQGSRGPAVKNLQVLLNFHLDGVINVPLVPDSAFGPKTREAVILFQTLNKIKVDGIVGSQTRSVLLSARNVTSQVMMAPDDDYAGGSLKVAAQRAQFRKGGHVNHLLSSPFLLASNDDTVPPPVTQQAPPQAVVETTVVVQTGQQVNINPWFLSPFVATVQGNILLKQDGRAPFLISPGLQLFFNQLQPNGHWSGQAFIQMGPTGLLKKGDFDLLNPFVQAFVQVNSGSHAGAGFAIGNQASYNLLGDKLSLFINAQAVSTTDLSTGLTSAPSAQILGGVGIDVFQLFRKK